MLAAEGSIFIVGWDVDSRVRFVGEDAPDDGAPEGLRDFLCHLVEQKPSLRIHVLLWDFSMLYALEREPLPALNLTWATPPQIEVCLDDIVPLGASHHEKLVIVDDKVAFCGGLDLAIRRWDTRRHEAENPDRVDPAGAPYGPFHDMQMIVDGDVARALSEHVVARWSKAACKDPAPQKGDGDPWPDHVTPEFENGEMAIARTRAPLGDRPGVHEVERLYIDCIAQARDVVYMENQFFTADTVAKALARRLKEVPELEAILVSSKEPHGFLEAHSMATGRERFMGHLEDAGVLDRVRLVYPRVDDGSADGLDVQIHAKLSIIDDRVLRVGSSNVNNRSMGTDGECDLAFCAANEGERARIRKRRDDLLGEHLGLSPDEVAAEIDKAGSIRALIDARDDAPRTLVPIDYRMDVAEGVTRVVTAIADPERPGDASRFVGDMLSARPGGLPIRGRFLVSGAVAAVVLLIAIWQISPLAEYTDPDRLRLALEELRGNAWAYLIVPAAFVLGSMSLFPITAMIAATALVFAPPAAFVIALTGSLLGAVATYGIGAAAGRPLLRRVMGKRLNKINRALAERGTLTVVTLRIVPVAPFTLINLAAGASHISLTSFLVGSVIGLVPGIAALTLVGDRLFEMLRDPTPTRTAAVVGAVVLWFAVAWLARAAVIRIADKVRRDRAR